VDYLDKPPRQVRGLRPDVNNQMAQSAWVAMTRETVERQSAKSAGPRVDAGVTELSEMTIGRTDDPENPVSRNGRPTRPRHCLGLDRGTHLGQRPCEPRQQAGHMTAIEPPVRILNFALASEGPSTHASYHRPTG
jgi:hypothetical protein